MCKIACITALLILLTACEHLKTALGEEQIVDLTGVPWFDAYSSLTSEDHDVLPRINTCVSGSGLSVNSTRFERGFGMGGNALLMYVPDGHAAQCTFRVGVDDASKEVRGVTFIDIRANGKSVLSKTLAKGDGLVPIDIPMNGVKELLIRIVAHTGVFTDIIAPLMVGDARLQAMLGNGPDVFDTQVAKQVSLPTITMKQPNGSVLFSCDYGRYGACLGLSNEWVCLVVAPREGGRVVHLGRTFTDNILGNEGAWLEPHPEDRRIIALRDTYHGAWKWKMDEDGTLRLLSTLDAPHGIRWSQTFYLLPNAPTVRTAIMMKNASTHDISWSAGAHFTFAPSAHAQMPAKPEETGRLAVTKGAVTLHIQAIEPQHGLFPYDGTRVRANGSRYVLFGEITPLAPGAYAMLEQYWDLTK